MSTVNQVQLTQAVLGSSDTALYTSPLLTTVKIGRAVFCNTDSAPHTITINITSGSSTAANTLISALQLSPGQSYVSPELAGQVFANGQAVRGLASTAAVVTLTMSGITIS